MMSETIIMLLAAFGIGFYHDATGSKQYELELTDGNKASVIIKKNGKYNQLIVEDQGIRVESDLLKNNTVSLNLFENQKKALMIMK